MSIVLFFGATMLVIVGQNRAYADQCDWVSTKYVYSTKKIAQSDTSAAQRSIISQAQESSQEGPWSIVKDDVSPPSGDPHDYLSWAPYHWPDCNWCTRGRTHFADTNGMPDDSDPTRYWDIPAGAIHLHRRMVRRRSRQSGPSTTQSFSSNDSGHHVRENPVQVPAELPTGTLHLGPSPSKSAFSANPTQGAQNAAKTKTKQPSCTPSSTKEMPPSASKPVLLLGRVPKDLIAWTTCPYVVRDGQVNPDVRTLPAVGAINDVSQAILSNALAFALSNSKSYYASVIQFVNTFFLDDATKMNPNMNFGQMVRGPGPSGRVGSWQGVLDLRGMIKVVNGISILKTSAAGLPPDLEDGINNWMSEYLQWLKTSDIAVAASKRGNNHGSFFTMQIVAVAAYVGELDTAKKYLQNFVSKLYPDQIAETGEQPFEAVRTRPFHYRCFNMEALISLAKVVDDYNLMNPSLWDTKTKYGANIQKAVDFLMKTNPKGEDISTLFPHVAAVAAAYGDPTGSYSAFLEKTRSNYKSQPFWFYDQPQALSRGSKLSSRDAESVVLDFACPPPFGEGGLDTYEVEVGLFKTCDDLRRVLLGESD